MPKLPLHIEVRFDKKFPYPYVCCGGDFCDSDEHKEQLEEIKSFIATILFELGYDKASDDITSLIEKKKSEFLNK